MDVAMVKAENLLNTSNILPPTTPKIKNLLPSEHNLFIRNSDLIEKDVPNENHGEDWCPDSLFTGVNKTPCLPKGKSFIDQLFEKYEDVNAKYLTERCVTPEIMPSRKTFTDLEDHTPSACYESEVTKSKKLNAIMEGRKDFCEILEHAGINSSTYLTGVFSSSKKRNPQKFECSTPIITQTSKSCRKASPLSLSGIQLLISPLGRSQNFNGSYDTPCSRSNFSLNQGNLLPTENMKAILLGVICYVDVRTEKENCSEIFKRELLAIGAKVEKNFTKKVTHVIFKEGKMSTYLKARSLNIPIVSVVWIEACKIARGPVDPNLYPPTKLDKYKDDDSPFTRMMERKLKRLRKACLDQKELKCGSLHLPSVRRSNKRKAMTDLKENKLLKRLINKKERHCTKKLNFIDIDEPIKVIEEKQNDLNPLEDILNQSNNLSDSSIFTKFKLKTVPKRKSAPGALAKKKKARLKTLNENLLQESKANKKRSRSKSPVKENDSDVQIVSPVQTEIEEPMNKKNVQSKKKRKLYYPRELNTIQSIHFEDVEVSHSVPELPLTNINENKICSVPKSQNIEADESIISPYRNSISFFIQNDEKNTSNRRKQAPTIVFTSIHRDECKKLSTIVKKLGTFELEDKVSERTSHVVTNCRRRTLNFLRGLARGCWIVGDEWILKSEISSRWLAEKHFELSAYSPAIVECRLQRQAFKTSFYMDLFSKCGLLYVAPSTSPPQKELIDLIKLCGGKVVTYVRGAKIIIGENMTSNRTGLIVREKWILDSIFNNELQDIKRYITSPNNLEKLKNNSSDIK